MKKTILVVAALFIATPVGNADAKSTHNKSFISPDGKVSAKFCPSSSYGISYESDVRSPIDGVCISHSNGNEYIIEPKDIPGNVYPSEEDPDSFSDPIREALFSLDSKYLIMTYRCSETDHCILKFNLKTKKITKIRSGYGLDLVTEGKYKGHIKTQISSFLEGNPYVNVNKGRFWLYVIVDLEGNLIRVLTMQTKDKLPKKCYRVKEIISENPKDQDPDECISTEVLKINSK